MDMAFRTGADDVTLPAVRVLPAVRATTAVVLVLHGGRARGEQRTARWQLAYRRMVPIAHAVHRTIRDSGGAVWLVRNRVRGWNEPRLDPVRDARWAIGQVRRSHPDAAIVLIGHSMGGRAALRAADAARVRAVCTLAPWIEPGEPVGQLAGRAVLIAHGDRDRWTSPAASHAYASRARQVTPEVCRFEVRGAGHAMLHRAADWTGLVCAFVAGTLGIAPVHPRIAAGFRAPAPDGLSRPLPTGFRITR